MASGLALFVDELSSRKHWLNIVQQAGALSAPFTHSVDTLMACDRLIISTQQPLAVTLDWLQAHNMAVVLAHRLQENKPTLIAGTAAHAALKGGGQFDWLGLDVLPGVLAPFQAECNDAGERVKHPHLGWNSLTSVPPHPLWAGIQEGDMVYFSHQYYVDQVPRAQQLAMSNHGTYFPSVFYQQSLCAVQFRPEVSGRVGAQFIENFLRWRP